MEFNQNSRDDQQSLQYSSWSKGLKKNNSNLKDSSLKCS